MRHSQNSIPVDSAGLHKTTDRNARHVPSTRNVEIPAAIERDVGDAVTHRLEAELGDRTLLLAADDLGRRRLTRHSVARVCSHR